MKKNTLLLLILLAAYNYSQQVFTSSVYGISITYPNDWTISKGTENNVIFTGGIEGSVEINMVAQGNESFNDDIMKSYTPEQFFENNEKDLSAKYKDYKRINIGGSEISGVTCYFLIYSFSAENLNITSGMYMIVRNRFLFVITAGALTAEYSLYERKIKDCIYSINFF